MNNYREVEKLLDVCADLRPEINIRDEQGNMGLHFACINGNYNLALLLLKNEADCDSLNSLGQTGLMLCS